MGDRNNTEQNVTSSKPSRRASRGSTREKTPGVSARAEKSQRIESVPCRGRRARASAQYPPARPPTACALDQRSRALTFARERRRRARLPRSRQLARSDPRPAVLSRIAPAAPPSSSRGANRDRHGQVSPGQAAREGLVRVRRARDAREGSEQEVRRGALASRAPSRRVRARSTPRKNGSGVGNAATRGRSRGEPRRTRTRRLAHLPIPPRRRRRRKRWTSPRCPRRSATRASRRRSS